MNETPYDDAFYDHQSTNSRAAAAVVLGRLDADYHFESVLDVGCGVGTWLSACVEMDKTDILGVDGDYVNRDLLQIPRETYQPADLSQPLDLGRRFDLVMSLEVAEHLPTETSETFVQSLARHSDAVLFSAAIPMQGGTHHVNEQWCEFWQGHFDAAGFEPVDFLRDELWHDERVPFWYRQNMCFFRKRDAGRPILSGRGATGFPTRIHPEFYCRTAGRAHGLPGKETRKMRRAYRALTRADDT